MANDGAVRLGPAYTREQGYFGMAPGQSRYQSVSERLASRLDALEPVVARLLANEAKLIADSITTQAAIARLADHVQAVSANGELVEREQRTAALIASQALVDFRDRRLFGRLRWLFLGK